MVSLLEFRSAHRWPITLQTQIVAVARCWLENYQGMSSTDAYGIAEPSNIATALANAVGVRLRELPKTPARIVPLADFLLLPEVDIARENDLRPAN